MTLKEFHTKLIRVFRYIYDYNDYTETMEDVPVSVQIDDRDGNSICAVEGIVIDYDGDGNISGVVIRGIIDNIETKPDFNRYLPKEA